MLDGAGNTLKASPLAGPAELRQAFSCFPSGVTALCGLVDGLPVGMAVSSFTSVSLEPPLISVFIQCASSTWKLFGDRASFGVSVLAEDQDHICRKLSSRTDQRFDGVEWNVKQDGAVFIDGAAAWYECTKYDSYSVGDHYMILLRVNRATANKFIRPLVFHGSQLTRLAVN